MPSPVTCQRRMALNSERKVHDVSCLAWAIYRPDPEGNPRACTGQRREPTAARAASLPHITAEIPLLHRTLRAQRGGLAPDARPNRKAATVLGYRYCHIHAEVDL